MSRITLIALSLLLAGPATAQRPPQRPAGPGAGPRPVLQGRGLGAERLLGMRAQLELTADQISRLNAMRKAGVADRTAAMTRMLALRSDLAAGEITRDEFAASVRKEMEARRPRAEADREEIQKLLTDQQKDRLRQIGRGMLRRQMMMNRQGGGFGPGRGFRDPAMRRFGPGQDFMRQGPGGVRPRMGPPGGDGQLMGPDDDWELGADGWMMGLDDWLEGPEAWIIGPDDLDLEPEPLEPAR